MTTIVCDREVGYMAADRLQTGNDCGERIECRKIETVELADGFHLVGCSGHEGPAQWFLEWYRDSDEDHDPLDLAEDEEFTAVILTPKCEIIVCDRWMAPYRVLSRYYAIGSGGSFALGVLTAGCGVEKAMQTAIELDPNSGFGYDVVYIADANP